MPYVVNGPISRTVGDGDAKQKVQLKRGDHVSDELGAELRKTHAHALTRVPHTIHNCDQACGHHSHPWNQPTAETKPARKNSSTEATK